MTYQPPPGGPNQWSPPPPAQWQPSGPPPPPAKKQNVTLFVIFGVVAALLISGGVWAGLLLIGDAKEKVAEDATVTEPKAETEQGGIVLGGGDPTVHIYLDFICPACKQFDQDNGDVVAEVIDAEKATVVMHPLGFLDSASTTDYSSRAAAASVCAADADKFFDYYKTLFDNQPPEGGEGLSDKRLIELGTEAGLGGDFSGCVEDGTYLNWIERVTDEATGDGVDATPTVRIDGKTIDSSRFSEELAKATGLRASGCPAGAERIDTLASVPPRTGHGRTRKRCRE